MCCLVRCRNCRIISAATASFRAFRNRAAWGFWLRIGSSQAKAAMTCSHGTWRGSAIGPMRPLPRRGWATNTPTASKFTSPMRNAPPDARCANAPLTQLSAILARSLASTMAGNIRYITDTQWAPRTRPKASPARAGGIRWAANARCCVTKPGSSTSPTLPNTSARDRGPKTG